MFGDGLWACSRCRSIADRLQRLVSFGHAMFFGLGRLCVRLLPCSGRHSRSRPRSRWRLLVAVLGLVIGAICVRLNEIYFAFLTLAFQMLIYNIITRLGVVHRRRPGPDGRHSAAEIPRHRPRRSVASLFVLLGAVRRARPDASDRAARRSATRLRMIRDNQERAAFLGIDVFRVQAGLLSCWPAFSPVSAA